MEGVRRSNPVAPAVHGRAGIARRLGAALVTCVLLLAPIAARGWGPATHEVLARDLLERIEQRTDGPLTFLTSPPNAAIFVCASVSPDMTASLLWAGKSDKAYNGLLHRRSVAHALIRAAAAKHDRAGIAFGLGWLGHIEADHVMARVGGIVYEDLCGISQSGGAPMAAARTAIMKFAIDTVLLKENDLPEIEPYIDVSLLVPALDATLSGHRWSRDKPCVAIPSFALSFAATCTALHVVERAAADNTKAYPGMVEALDELCDQLGAGGSSPDGEDSIPGAAPERRIPRLHASLDAMDAALTAAIAQDAPASEPGDPAGSGSAEGSDPAPAGAPAPAPQSAPTDLTNPPSTAWAGEGLADRAWRAGREILATGAQFLWSHEFTRRIGQMSVERALALIDGSGGGRPSPRRAVITFVAAMADGVRTWPQVQERVRRAASASVARHSAHPRRHGPPTPGDGPEFH